MLQYLDKAKPNIFVFDLKKKQHFSSSIIMDLNITIEHLKELLFWLFTGRLFKSSQTLVCF